MENSYREVLSQKDVEVKQSFIESTAELFSMIMEEEVTPQQATCILSIMISALLVIFPIVMPTIIRIAAFCWLAISVWQMKSLHMLSNED